MAGSGLSGDWGSLRSLAAAIGEVSGIRARAKVTRAVADAALEQLEFGFEHAQAPNGEPWEPLKQRNGKPLTDKGTLRASWKRVITEEGFSLISSSSYAIYHQQGATLKAARNAHSKSGRFLRRSNASVRKAGAVTVSFSGGGRLPARPMVPDPTELGLWGPALELAAARAMEEIANVAR